MKKNTHGFTLVELLAVMVIAAILATTLARVSFSNDVLQLQSSRDQFATAFYAAQQLAMATDETVQLIVSSPNQVDLRVNSASANIAGIAFPISLQSNQTLSEVSFSFDRLGQTTPATLVLAQGSRSVNIRVTSTGYIY